MPDRSHEHEKCLIHSFCWTVWNVWFNVCLFLFFLLASRFIPIVIMCFGLDYGLKWMRAIVWALSMLIALRNIIVVKHFFYEYGPLCFGAVSSKTIPKITTHSSVLMWNDDYRICGACAMAYIWNEHHSTKTLSPAQFPFVQRQNAMWIYAWAKTYDFDLNEWIPCRWAFTSWNHYYRHWPHSCSSLAYAYVCIDKNQFNVIVQYAIIQALILFDRIESGFSAKTISSSELLRFHSSLKRNFDGSHRNSTTASK